MALVDERKAGVLVYLREHGPSTGYDLAQSDEIDYTQSYIYDILTELKEDGMLEVADRETSGRQRVTYKLTENGELLLQALDR